MSLFYQANQLKTADFRTLIFWSLSDVVMMQRAVELAKMGAEQGEIPVGAVVAHAGQILGEGFNCPISTHDSTHHAEIVAIRQACQRIGNYRLPADSTIYVTLEPCTMCFGALVHSRVSRVVFGAYEPKAGVICSQLNLPNQGFYNHTLKIHGGLLAQQSSQILSDFFKKRRREKREQIQILKNQIEKTS